MTEFDKIDEMLSAHFFYGFTVKRMGKFSIYHFTNYSVNRPSQIRNISVKVDRKTMGFMSAKFNDKIFYDINELLEAIE